MDSKLRTTSPFLRMGNLQRKLQFQAKSDFELEFDQVPNDARKGRASRFRLPGSFAWGAVKLQPYPSMLPEFDHFTASHPERTCQMPESRARDASTSLDRAAKVQAQAAARFPAGATPVRLPPVDAQAQAKVQ